MLGYTATDRVTGFSGVVTGYAHYLSGCNQFLVAPRVKATGEFVPSEWFDEQRLVVDAGVPPVVLDNSSGPGPDRQAPKR
jgi:hypothetical protein